ncbi:MAG: nitroreductase/quinone reductase family protein [Pseudolysinimonas sp.]
MSDWNEKMIAEFRENNGTAGRFGRGLVILHTIGAKSGEERLVPAAGFRNEDGWMVIASAAGSPKHPGWYHNLKKHPRFEIEAPAEEGIETAQVNAVELTDDAAYDKAWTSITTAMPGFLEYPKTTEGRRMPIFQLQRV